MKYKKKTVECSPRHHESAKTKPTEKAMRTSYVEATSLRFFARWPEVPGLECTVLDVLTRNISPQRYERTADGWRHIGKNSYGRSIDLLHVNENGYVIDEPNQSIGISTLLVTRNRDNPTSEVEDLIWYPIGGDNINRKPIYTEKYMSFRYGFVLGGGKQFSDPMRKLASSAHYDYLKTAEL